MELAVITWSMAQAAGGVALPIPAGDINGWLVAAIAVMFSAGAAAATWFARVHLPDDETRNLKYFDAHMVRLDALSTVHENTLKEMRGEFNIERLDQYKRFETSLETMHTNTVEANTLVRDELNLFRESIGKCLDSVNTSLLLLNDVIRNQKSS